MSVRVVFVAVRRVPPHFSIPPENAEVLPGGAVNLTCVAIGSPMPFVRWRLGAVELTPEDNPPIGKNILQLTDVRETATYTCVAASDLGNIEYDAEVRVKGTPVISVCICRTYLEHLVCPHLRHMHSYFSKLFFQICTESYVAFSASTLSVWHQKRHLAVKSRPT